MLRATNTYQITDYQLRVLLSRTIILYEQHLTCNASKRCALEYALDEMMQPDRLAEHTAALPEKDTP